MDEFSIKSAGRDARRQAILNVARDVFLIEGYAAASMSAIAARVGGSKATLYNYFSSKEELFTAVLQDHCDRGHAALFDLEMEGRDLAVILRTLGQRFVRFMLSEQVLAMHRLVVAESNRFPEIGQALYEAGPLRGKARLTVYIQDAVASGRLRLDDPARAAEQLMDLCLSGLYRLRLWNVTPPPNDDQISANVDAALATFFAAYEVREAKACPQ